MDDNEEWSEFCWPTEAGTKAARKVEIIIMIIMIMIIMIMMITVTLLSTTNHKATPDRARWPSAARVTT